VSRDINVVALVKGEERYIFLFNDKQKSETLRTLGRYASNSELSFSWYDAAVLSQKVRNATKQGNESLTSDRGLEFPEVNDLFSGEEPLA
jgi:IS30 family transposase